MKSILTKIILITITSIFGLGLVSQTPVFAEKPSICSSIKEKLDNGTTNPVWSSNGCGSSGEETETELEGFIVNILNGIIAVLGLVAVVFVLIGGVNYMTSAGDPSKTQKAKNTILYALIGLVVCVLAFAIVNFAIKNIIGGQRSAPAENSDDDSGYIIYEKDVAFLKK